MDKTLIVTNDFPPKPGGIQTFLHNLATRLDPDKLVVYAPTWKDGAEVAEFDARQPFPVHRDPSKMLLPTPAVSRRATRLAREYECASVLFGAAAPLGVLAPGLRRAGVSTVVSMSHGHEAGWARMPVLRRMLRQIGESADTLTYLGEYTRARIASALSPAASERMVQLPPGVDVKDFHPDSGGVRLRERMGLSDRPVVVCVSRLVPRKGQDTLIRALPRIRSAVPGATLVIVGAGPYDKTLHEVAERVGVRDSVVFTGAVPSDELPAYFGVGDVFAMPCRTRYRGMDVEGLGIVYLEASATGLPVVAGASGGAPDAVLPGETGYVVDGYSTRHVTDRIVELLCDPELRRRMGESGRAWVEDKWRWETLADRLQELL